MGVDEYTLAVNLSLIIGGVFVLGFLFVFVIASWTAIKVAIALYLRRRARLTWLKVSRRADGKRRTAELVYERTEARRVERGQQCQQRQEGHECSGGLRRETCTHVAAQPRRRLDLAAPDLVHLRRRAFTDHLS